MTEVEFEEKKSEIFCFYKLSLDLPRSFFAKLGDSKIV